MKHRHVPLAIELNTECRGFINIKEIKLMELSQKLLRKTNVNSLLYRPVQLACSDLLELLVLVIFNVSVIILPFIPDYLWVSIFLYL